MDKPRDFQISDKTESNMRCLNTYDDNLIFDSNLKVTYFDKEHLYIYDIFKGYNGDWIIDSNLKVIDSYTSVYIVYCLAVEMMTYRLTNMS